MVFLNANRYLFIGKICYENVFYFRSSHWKDGQILCTKFKTPTPSGTGFILSF